MSDGAETESVEGILLVDKEPGWTSHDVVAKLRGITRQRRTGHTGTLDPAATGLLVVCLGWATRLVEYMSAHNKAYEGEIALGITTDTDDAEGTVLDQRAAPELASIDLAELAQRFTGNIEQVPPAFSAVKVDGQRAYSAARKGRAVELQSRPVRVDRLELESAEPGRLLIRVECGPGTYVRSLARDIGLALGCGGHLASLRRTTVGPFDIDEAMTIAEIQAVADAGGLPGAIRGMDEGVMEHDAILLGGDRAAMLARGERVRVATSPWEATDDARVYGLDGRFRGIARVSDMGLIIPQKMLPTPTPQPPTPTYTTRSTARLRPSRWEDGAGY